MSRNGTRNTRLPPLVAPATNLTPGENERYARHLVLPEIGDLGQRRLKNARVLVVGAGGLGSPVLVYLAAAGIGTLGIVDDDVVELSNLQRQIIYRIDDIGRSKVESARDVIAALNPSVHVRIHRVRLDTANAEQLFADYDTVVDGSDNFATRYLVNDVAALLEKPHVWGSVDRWDGQLSVSWDGHGPTYRDIYPEAPETESVPSCNESGVLGSVCAAIGGQMATEVVKLITGAGSTLLGRVLVFNGLTSSWREMSVTCDPAHENTTTRSEPAATADDAQTVTLPADSAALVDNVALVDNLVPVDSAAPAGDVVPSDRAIVCEWPPRRAEPQHRTIVVRELAAMLAQRKHGETDFDLIDVRESYEHQQMRIPGSLLVPLGRIQTETDLPELSHDRTIIAYCAVGVRSSEALTTLSRKGYVRVMHLDGGMRAWMNEMRGEFSVCETGNRVNPRQHTDP